MTKAVLPCLTAILPFLWEAFSAFMSPSGAMGYGAAPRMAPSAPPAPRAPVHVRMLSSFDSSADRREARRVAAPPSDPQASSSGRGNSASNPSAAAPLKEHLTVSFEKAGDKAGIRIKYEVRLGTGRFHLCVRFH